MSLFSRTVDFETPFRKNDVVAATIDLPGVPAGTEGRIKVINGFDWRRYWVFFNNGVELGQLDERELVRPNHWDKWFERQAEGDAEAIKASEAANASAEDGADATAGAAAVADSNDPLAAIRAMVPPHLLERSAEARSRLTGG